MYFSKILILIGYSIYILMAFHFLKRSFLYLENSLKYSRHS